MGAGTSIDDDLRMALGIAIGIGVAEFLTCSHAALRQQIGTSILVGLVGAVTVLVFSRVA